MSYKKATTNSADTGTAPGDFTTKRTAGTQWGAEHLERTRWLITGSGEHQEKHMLLPPPKMAAWLKARAEFEEAQKVKE